MPVPVQIKEAKLQSLAHVKKIQELEMQLRDAQNTIASLEVELQRANTELDQTRRTSAKENRNSLSTSQKTDNSEMSSHHSKMCGRDKSKSPATSETSCVPRNTKENETVGNMEDPCHCDPELYRNGYTQRIGRKAAELKSLLIRGKSGTPKNPCGRRSVVEEILQTKRLTNCKRRRGKRSKSIYKHAVNKEQRKSEYEPCDTPDRNGCMLLLQALEHDLSPIKISDRQGGNRFSDLKDGLHMGRKETLNPCTANSGGKDTLQVKKIQMKKGKRSKTVKALQRGGLRSIGGLESARRFLKEINDDNVLNSRLSSGSIHSHFDTHCRVSRAPLAKCTTEAMMDLAETKQSQFNFENISPQNLKPIMDEIGDEGTLEKPVTVSDALSSVKYAYPDATNTPVDLTESITPDYNTSGKKEDDNDETCNLDSGKGDVAPVHSSSPKEEYAKIPSHASIQTKGARCIKYTFNRRKRKSEPLENISDGAVPGKSICLVSPTGKQEPETKPQLQVILTESPRSNRQLLQVARQVCDVPSLPSMHYVH